VVSMLASGTQDRGFFRAKKSSACLRKGSKAACPMSQICGMSKNPKLAVEVASYRLNYQTFLASFRSSLTEDSDVA
jgi:hypothetical protein